MVLLLPDSWSNWNLEMLVFEERGKPEYPEKNLSEQRREPTTNSTHTWRWCRDLNLGHIGGRWALSPLGHPLLPKGWRKVERGWKWRQHYQWTAKTAKLNVNMDCFSLIKGRCKSQGIFNFLMSGNPESVRINVVFVLRELNLEKV